MNNKYTLFFLLLLLFFSCSSSGNEYDELNMAIAKTGDVRVVEKFLDRGGDINTKLQISFTSSGSHAVLDDGSGPNMTLLMSAAFHSDVSYDIAQLLLKRGADVHARDKHGETAMTAARMGNGSEKDKEAMMALLRRYGAE